MIIIIIIIIILIVLIVIGVIFLQSNEKKDCQVSEWSLCNKNLGMKFRNIIIPPNNNGLACPILETECPVNCEFSEWSECNKQTGKQIRTIILEPKNNGFECPILETECPVNCEVSDWEECNKQNGNKIRNIIVNTKNNGTPCPILVTSCPINCEISNWSACDKQSGKQTRSIFISPINNGSPCPILETLCPVNCEVSDWSNCNLDTGKRTRTIIVNPKNINLTCPPLETLCPVDCSVSTWTPCTNIGFDGTALRNIIINTKNNGLTCPPLRMECSINNNSLVTTINKNILTLVNDFFNINIDNIKELILCSLIIYTQHNNKFWIGFVGISGITSVSSFIKITSNSIELVKDGNNLTINNVTTSDGVVNYNLISLLQKTDFNNSFNFINKPGTGGYPLYSINLNNRGGTSFFGRDYIDNGDLCIFNLILWTQNNNKWWIGIVCIYHSPYPGHAIMYPLGNNIITVSNWWGGGGDNNLTVNNCVAADGAIYFRVNSLLQKNSFGGSNKYNTPDTIIITKSNKISFQNLNKYLYYVINLIIWTSTGKTWVGFFTNKMVNGISNIYVLGSNNNMVPNNINNINYIELNNILTDETIYYKYSLINYYNSNKYQHFNNIYISNANEYTLKESLSKTTTTLNDILQKLESTGTYISVYIYDGSEVEKPNTWEVMYIDTTKKGTITKIYERYNAIQNYNTYIYNHIARCKLSGVYVSQPYENIV